MKILTVLGARPQFVKAAPVSRALAAAGLKECLVDTGQHYDDSMAGVFYRELGLPNPKYSLNVGSGSHGRMTSRIIEGVEQVLLTEKANMVLVYGDTNSTLGAAIASAKLHIPVTHVEAGLRSHRFYMPEEINRRLTDQLSELLLCPTDTAVENLRAEGIPSSQTDNKVQQVANVGDVMVDSISLISQLEFEDPLITELGVGRYALLTIHRAESTDDPLILSTLVNEVLNLADIMPVLFPIHPRTKKALDTLDLSERLCFHPNIKIVDPLPYSRFINAERNARLIATDSGGVQKEACMLRVPCLTLRDETEWVETVVTGWNRVIGRKGLGLASAAEKAVPPAKNYVPLYGDGHAANRVKDMILSSFCCNE